MFDRVCYNKVLGYTENGRRFIHAPMYNFVRWEVMLWNIT